MSIHLRGNGTAGEGPGQAARYWLTFYRSHTWSGGRERGGALGGKFELVKLKPDFCEFVGCDTSCGDNFGTRKVAGYCRPRDEFHSFVRHHTSWS